MSSSTPGRLRQNADLLNRIKVIWVVQSRLQKYFLSRQTQITFTNLTVPCPSRGAFRDRHGRWARDAVDADGALTKALEADGEVVWS